MNTIHSCREGIQPVEWPEKMSAPVSCPVKKWEIYTKASNCRKEERQETSEGIIKQMV